MAVIPGEGARCRICGEWRTQADFYLRNAETGNRFSHCRFCATVRARVRLERVLGRPVLPKPHDTQRTEKVCIGCGEMLPIERFPMQSAKTGLRRPRCYPCHAANNGVWKAQNADRKKAADAAYREANRAELTERQRVWRAEHPEAYQAIHSRWKARNKAAVNAATHRRRNHLACADGHWTAAEWAALKAEYDHRCLMCERQEPEIALTVDHIVPVSKGGSNCIDNLQPLCKSCNSLKHQGIIDLRRRE